MMVLGRRVVAPAEQHVELDRDIYPTRGIDVSAHNGEIDFSAVARAGVQFVFIKASEGASWRDSYFERNYRTASDAGLMIGAYHFFRFDVEGWRQSVNILRAIGERRLDLPVAIDVEEWGNPTEVTTEKVVSELRSLIDLLRQSGRDAIIYTNKNGYYRFIRNRFDDVPLWICSFSTPPLPEHSRWTLWQHSHKGRVDGVAGAVDLVTYNTPRRNTFERWIDSLPAVCPLGLH